MAAIDMDVTQELADWRTEQLHSDDLVVLYFRSPAWRSKVLELWTAYDGLEKRRAELGVPRLEWQDSVEDVRDTDLKNLTEPVFPAWIPEHHSMIPLWVHLNEYLGRADPDPERRLYGWDSALLDWQKIQDLHRESEDYVQSLSTSQLRSLLLLQEWWTSAYADPELIEAARAYMESERDEATTWAPSLDREELGPKTLTDSSLYHSTVFSLFLAELHPQEWGPYLGEDGIGTLQADRNRASDASLAQKMAYATLYPGNATDTQGKPYPRRIDPRPDLQLHSDASQGTQRKPYYLWDSERQATVVVHTLPQCPEYLCISHTWGRWRTSTTTDVPGVPWAVPENTIHDVRRLPDKLRQLGLRYIWLDLFCIPQDRGDRSKEEIANQASIFRGSQNCIAWLHDIDSWIGTRAALDWLGLQHLELTTKSTRDLLKQEIPKAAVAAASAPAQLWVREKFAEAGSDPYHAYGEPSSWFTSLWTLQECAICPDMELFSRDWQRLEDRHGIPISVRCLARFVEHTRQNLGKTPLDDVPFSKDTIYTAKIARKKPDIIPYFRGPQVPIAVVDLADLVSITNLDHVLRATLPMAVLMTANLRQCSSKNRAPAIMSALGVTDWYKKSLTSQEPQEMVFDMYPIEFLCETARKLGAIFYETDHEPLRRDVGEDLALQDIDVESLREASMLPVSSRPGWLGRVLGTPSQRHIHLENHPSVTGWRINAEGSISLDSVGLFMTSGDEPAQKVEGWITCGTAEPFMPGSKHANTYSDRVEDILESLRSLTVANRCIYAVALYKAGHELHGLFLEERARRGSKSYLIKIGGFRVLDIPMPESTSVEWEVL